MDDISAAISLPNTLFLEAPEAQPPCRSPRDVTPEMNLAASYEARWDHYGFLVKTQPEYARLFYYNGGKCQIANNRPINRYVNSFSNVRDRFDVVCQNARIGHIRYGMSEAQQNQWEREIKPLTKEAHLAVIIPLIPCSKLAKIAPEFRHLHPDYSPDMQLEDFSDCKPATEKALRNFILDLGCDGKLEQWVSENTRKLWNLVSAFFKCGGSKRHMLLKMGHILAKGKKAVPAGTYQHWVVNVVGMSKRTAADYRRTYKAFGEYKDNELLEQFSIKALISLSFDENAKRLAVAAATKGNFIDAEKAALFFEEVSTHEEDEAVTEVVAEPVTKASESLIVTEDKTLDVVVGYENPQNPQPTDIHEADMKGDIISIDPISLTRKPGCWSQKELMIPISNFRVISLRVSNEIDEKTESCTQGTRWKIERNENEIIVTVFGLPRDAQESYLRPVDKTTYAEVTICEHNSRRAYTFPVGSKLEVDLEGEFLSFSYKAGNGITG